MSTDTYVPPFRPFKNGVGYSQKTALKNGTCGVCGKPFIGATDRWFCSAMCRAISHVQRLTKKEKLMRVNVLPGQQDISEGDLGELQNEFAHAMSRLSDAELAEDRARSVTTNARNQVNALQRRIDGVLVGLRQNAPRDSSWADRGVRLAK